MTNPIVIVIAGPTGSGKTTLSKMLSEHYRCAYISEDEAAKEIFPDTYINIEDYPDKARTVERALWKKANAIFGDRESVVIDCINLREEFIKEINRIFEKHFNIKSSLAIGGNSHQKR